MSCSKFRASCVATTLLVSSPPTAAAERDEAPAPLKSLSASQEPIVVDGRRASERYRIPVELRTLPPEYDRHARASDSRLACRAVGPMGCGITPNRLLTVGSDGRVHVGPDKEQ